MQEQNSRQGKERDAGLRPLKLVEAQRYRLACPWDHYEAVGDRPLDGYTDGQVVFVDSHPKGMASDFVTIQITNLTWEVRTRLTAIQKLLHRNLSAVREVFFWRNSVYAVFESSPVSLDKLAGHANLTEPRFTAIIAQVRELVIILAEKLSSIAP